MGRVYAGVDLAEADDHTVVIILQENGLVLGVHQLPTGLGWPEIVKRVDFLIKGAVVVAIDATGVGAGIIPQLQHKGRILPFKFTATSKPALIQILVEAIQRGAITLRQEIEGTGILVDELRRFSGMPTRKGWKFSGKSTGKDDAVCALALAIHARSADDRRV